MAPEPERGRVTSENPVCKACGRDVDVVDGKFAVHWKGAPGVMCPGAGKPAYSRTDIGRDQGLLYDRRSGGVRLVSVYPSPDWTEGVPR